MKSENSNRGGTFIIPLFSIFFKKKFDQKTLKKEKNVPYVVQIHEWAMTLKEEEAKQREKERRGGNRG